MSKLQHTPGPWNNKNIEFFARDIIGICATFKDDKTEARANARLIAAAPEMLNELIKIYTTMYMTQRECYWMPIKDIIEKATGMSIEEVISL